MLSALPGEITERIPFSWSDLAVHAAAYSVLGVALAHARVRGALDWPHVMMISIGAVYGATDELHQSFVPGRVPAVDDWLADAVGVATGYGLAWLFVRARRRPTEAETTGTTG